MTPRNWVEVRKWPHNGESYIEVTADVSTIDTAQARALAAELLEAVREIDNRNNEPTEPTIS